MRRSAAKRSFTSGFTTSLRWMTPRMRPPSTSPSGVPPERAILSTAARNAGGSATFWPACSRANLSTESTAPLRSLRLPISTPDSRVIAENSMNLAPAGADLAAHVIFLLHQRDDRAAFRGLVGIAGEQRGLRGFALGDAGHRNDFGRQPVAEGDGAGLVEQQRIDVAGGFHRAAGHRQHVEAHQPVHAGNADGREQRADGGRDQRDEQRHQDDDGDRAAGIGGVARDGRGREHEDDGQADQQDVQRDLVRRLLPLGAFDQLDHAVEERRAGRGRDADRRCGRK